MHRELKSCPFCGSFSELDERSVGGARKWFRFCWKCQAAGPLCDTADDAIAAWNRRAEQPTPDPLAGGSLRAVGDEEMRTFLRDVECEHKVEVQFDAEAARKLSSHEIRQRWPRFSGPCPQCGCHLVAYASMEHYVSGGW